MSKRQSTERIRALLSGSLAVWGLEGTVALDIEGGEARLTTADGAVVRVVQTLQGWQVINDRQSSEHAGVPGMLRALRRTLAPGQRPGRMIVAPSPGVE